MSLQRATRITPGAAPGAATRLPLVAACLLALLIASCQPTLKVESPKEPITINLNITLDAEVRLKIEEQAEEVIDSNPDIF